MARVTVEDCLEKVANPFDLVMLASQRSHDLAAGAHATYAATPGKKEKNTVIALREIADGTVAPQNLEARLTRKWQRLSEPTLLDFPAPSAALAAGAPRGAAGFPTLGSPTLGSPALGSPALESPTLESSGRSSPDRDARLPAETPRTPPMPMDRIFEDVAEQDLHE